MLDLRGTTRYALQMALGQKAQQTMAEGSTFSLHLLTHPKLYGSYTIRTPTS